VNADEQPGAAPVVVLGYDVWRSRFNEDSSVVGRLVRVGSTQRTVVGVMPEGFAFPVNYAMWVPLRVDPADSEWGGGPSMYVFGRLAPGATLEGARAELATLSAAIAHNHPASHRDLRASLLPFAQSFFRMDDPQFVAAMRTVVTTVILLVVVICVNVATLVYARTVTRQTEIAVRSALGATRGRIIAQFFGEACVLAGCGSLVGIGLLSLMSAQLDRALVQIGYDVLVPFWIRFDVGPSTLTYLVGLTLLGATIIGVLPALRLTGRRAQLGLQRLAGGHSTIRMGRLWTALILAEVAFAVALLPTAVRFTGEWIGVATAELGLPADRYLSARLGLEGGPTPDRDSPRAGAGFNERFAAARDALLARLEVDRDVASVTYASAIPGSEATARFEVDAVGANKPEPFFARVGNVDRRYFATFGIPTAVGRELGPMDADSTANTIVVNRSFVDAAFRGVNAIGRRVRILTHTDLGVNPGPWLEVVGVVGDFPGELPFPGIPRAAIYRSANITHLYPVTMTLRLHTDAIEYTRRLTSLARAVRPDFILAEVAPLEALIRAQQLPLQWIALSLAIVTASVLVLSCAGVYALMSVVVTQRRREIGIRSAMGADPRRLLSTLFSRAAAQVGGGVVIGITAAALIDVVLSDGELLGAHRIAILLGVTAAMAAFALFAALAPARAALRISPTEALKAE
jgi:predicted permease